MRLDQEMERAAADVLIIGAGPAGLTAAYCLTKEASSETPSVLIIEKDPTEVGGIARTIRHNEFAFDIGGQRFFSSNREVADLWQEILPGEAVQRTRRSRIFYGGKFYSYPLNAFEALANLGILNSAACLISYAKARLRPIPDPQTFHHWVRNQFGERLYRIFFKTYTERAWGMSCDDISADGAAQRIKGFDLRAMLIHAWKRVLGRTAAEDPAGCRINPPADTFLYANSGPRLMWDAAAKKIRDRGGRLLMGRELRGLSFDDETKLWTVEVSTAHGPEIYTARHIISSAPVRELIDRIAPRPISLFHARGLRYRDLIAVTLRVKNPAPFKDERIYIHDPSMQVGRVQTLRGWSAGTAPQGECCLGLEYFCVEGDSLWNSTDAGLIALAKTEIARIGLVAAHDIVDGCVVRQPKAYPVYDDDYRHNMSMIRLDLETHYPTLHLVGRNGMHQYNNLDQAMLTAMMAARNILAGARLHNAWNVNEPGENLRPAARTTRRVLARLPLLRRRNSGAHAA